MRGALGSNALGLCSMAGIIGRGEETSVLHTGLTRLHSPLGTCSEAAVDTGWQVACPRQTLEGRELGGMDIAKADGLQAGGEPPWSLGATLGSPTCSASRVTRSTCDHRSALTSGAAT